MKKIIFILGFTFLFIHVFSQNTWEKLIKTENDEILYTGIQLKNGDFIFNGGFDRYYTNTDEFLKNAYLIKTNKNGDILKEKIIQKQDTFLYGFKIISLSDTTFLTFSKAGTASGQFLNLMITQKYDTTFNLLSEKKYKIPKDSTDIFNFKITENYAGNLILSGATVHQPQVILDMFFWEFNKEGDSIKSKFYTDTIPTWSLAFKILEKKDTSGYYCLAKRLAFSPAGMSNRILELDYNFNQLSYKYFPVQIDNNGDLLWLNDTVFLSSGIYNGADKSQQRDFGVITIDTSFNTYNYNYFGFPDTAEIMAPHKSLIFNEGDNFIYLAGISNYDIYSGSFSQMSSTIQFVKTDLNLQPLLEKYYKGDACYYTNFFTKTNDGGFLFLATRYDYQTQDNERDIFILKVDSLGNLPASIDEPEIKAHDLILCPNPGNDFLNIRTAVQSIGGVFSMFDITGKQILSQVINRANTRINTTNLPSGIYVYRYMLNNKIIETGKWVKK